MLPNTTVLLKQSWKIYKKRFRTILGITIIFFLCWFFIPVFLSILIPLMSTVGYLGWGFHSLLVWVMIGFLILISVTTSLWSQIALLYAIKDREEEIGVRESYRRGRKNIIAFLGTFILFELIVIVGSFLFFVPGLIFLIWFIFAPFILVTENKKGWASLLASKAYVKGNWLGVFWRFLFIIIFTYVVEFFIALIWKFVGNGAQFFVVSLIALSAILPQLALIYLFLIYENLKSLKKNENV